MPLQSKRGTEIGVSPIRSLVPFARQAKAEGKKVYYLNIGQPDIPTPPEAIQAIRKIEDTVIAYGPSEGLLSLREKVAKYYDKFDAQLRHEDVYVTTGASEAILFALMATCDAGDEVIIPEPFYANYLGFSHMSAVSIRPVTTTFKDQFALPSASEFERRITHRTKAIFLCNPGNPTGQMYTREDLEKLVILVRQYDLFLIVDEVYREFCYDRPFTSILAFEGMEDNVIVIDSISKVFSSCGSRIGYLITKNRSVQETVNKYAQLRLCPPYLGQKVAEACYEVAESYIKKARAEYIRRRQILHQGLTQISGIQCYMPQAAFYIICELPVPDAEAFCRWLLAEFDYNGATVMLAPATGFYFDKYYGRSQVRIAYVLNEHDLQQAVQCLKIGLQVYQETVLAKAV